MRRRETQRLPLPGKHRQNAPDGRQKAHIQHAVGFVEHQDFHVTQVGQSSIDEVLQPSRSRNDQSASPSRRPGSASSPIRRQSPAPLWACSCCAVFRIARELASPVHASATRTSALRLARRLAPQHLDQRNQERQRLAGAGLGRADYVFAFQGRRNRLLLDRG